MSTHFKASEYPNTKIDEVPQEVASIISASEVATPEVHTWAMQNFVKEVDSQVQAREREVYSQIEKKLQPEINRQTEILKKEAYEEAKKAGFDAGYDEGKKLGEQEARDITIAEAETQLSAKIECLEALLTSLNEIGRASCRERV